jgi:DNA polymerase III delta prime subunit
MTNSLFNFAAGGAIVGLLTACWGHIRAVLWKVLTLFIQRVELRGTGYLNPVLLGYMIRKYKRSRVYDRAYGAHQEHIRQQERNGLVGYEEFGDNSLILWNGWLPFVFSQAAKADPSKSPTSGYGNSPSNNVAFTTLTFIRGMLDVEKIIQEAIDERNKLNWSNEQLTKDEQKRFYVKYVPDFTRTNRGGNEQTVNATTMPWYLEGRFRVLGFKPEDLGRGRRENRRALDDLIFPDPVKQLINEIKLWRVNREWYHKRGIPWKRGWLLYGVPGSGKTALARAFAEDLDMPIWVYNLNELTSFEFMKAWIEMQTAAPCIALIEDIDNVFDGRRNVGVGRRSYMSIYHRRNGQNNSSPSPDDSPENPDKNKRNLSEDDMMMGGMLSFDVFLNMLDGVERNDGIFTIITTNNLDAIDEALGKPRRHTDGTLDFISTRPGRIDKAIELTYMIRRDKIRMAQKILADYPEAMQAVLDHLNYNAELQETPAQFQERCAQLALRAFWNEQNKHEQPGLGSRHKGIPNEDKEEDGEVESFPPVDPDVLYHAVGTAKEKPLVGEGATPWYDNNRVIEDMSARLRKKEKEFIDIFDREPAAKIGE